MNKTKVFSGQTLEEVLKEFNEFINDPAIEVCSFSHTYRNSKRGWGTLSEMYNVELVAIYKTAK